MSKSTPSYIIATFSCFFILITHQDLQAQSKKTDPASTATKNKELVRNTFQQIINQQSTDYYEKVYAANVIDHSAWPGQAPGLTGLRKAVGDMLKDIPDLKVTIEDIFAEGDKVATRETWKGTKKSTGKTGTGNTIHIFLIRDNKITEEWSQGWDWLEKF